MKRSPAILHIAQDLQWTPEDVLTPIESAYQRLKLAGLHVHLCDDRLIGGSHYDDSDHRIRMVLNSFTIVPEGTGYRLKRASDGQTDGIGCLTLDQAIRLVIDTIKPQPNIEAPPRPPQKGPQLY